MLKTYNKANYFSSSLLTLLLILGTDFQVKKTKIMPYYTRFP